MELKAIKLYVNSYRDKTISHEEGQRILDDLVEACDPVWMQLEADFIPAATCTLWCGSAIGVNPADECRKFCCKPSQVAITEARHMKAGRCCFSHGPDLPSGHHAQAAS